MRARELGDAIRRAMKQAGIKSADVARHLGWSDSRISRLLSGKRGGSTADVISVLSVCGVSGDERERLIALSREHEEPNWFQLNPRIRTLLRYENKATAIREFEFNLIPGLLQTEGYTRALMAAAVWLTPHEVEERVLARMGRQRLLRRPDPPALTCYVHEFALRLPVGGPAVMSEQMHKLLRLAVRPYLTLRVVPAACGALAAVHGAFRLMEFREMNPLVYLDTHTSSVYLETADELRVYRSILARLQDAALDEAESREVIAALAVELYADGGDHERFE